jgi:hypothetical protein
MLFPSSEILPRCNLRLEKSKLFMLGKIIAVLRGASAHKIAFGVGSNLQIHS